MDIRMLETIWRKVVALHHHHHHQSPSHPFPHHRLNSPLVVITHCRKGRCPAFATKGVEVKLVSCIV